MDKTRSSLKQTDYTCIVCPKGCLIKVLSVDPFRAEGNVCSRGKAYVEEETSRPMRMVSGTVRGAGEMIPVRTSKTVPKDKVLEVMKLLHQVKIDQPVQMYDTIIENILGLGVDIIATRSSHGL